MLDNSALEVYNKVFSFLLKLKRATWAIEFIAGRGMIPDLSLYLSLSHTHALSHTLYLSPYLFSKSSPLPLLTSWTARQEQPARTGQPTPAAAAALPHGPCRDEHPRVFYDAHPAQVGSREGRSAWLANIHFIHRAALLTNHSAVARPPWVGLCSLLHAV